MSLERARRAMDELYSEMEARGVKTTMMYDFGVPAVAREIEEAVLAERERCENILREWCGRPVLLRAHALCRRCGHYMGEFNRHGFDQGEEPGGNRCIYCNVCSPRGPSNWLPESAPTPSVSAAEAVVSGESEG